METNRPSIIVVIPALNEEESIGLVIEDVRKHLPEADILVVDDDSRDGTSARARQCGVLALRLPQNLGVGGCVEAGYRYAFEKGYDVIVRVDGDGQHDAAYCHDLLAAVLSGEADMAFGSRFIGDDRGGSEFHSTSSRRLGIRLLSFVIWMATGKRFYDVTSGFGAYSRQAMECLLVGDYSLDFPEPESLVILCRVGFRPVEVPVKMRPRQGGSSSLRLVGSFLYMFNNLLAVSFDAFDYRLRRRRP